MKKYINILFTSLILISCSDFLEESPKSEIAVNQFFNSPESARSTVNSIYRSGFTSLYFGPSDAAKGTGIMSGLFFDDVWFAGKVGQYGQELSFDAERSSQVFYGAWQARYQAISRANTAIKYIPTISGLSEAESNRLLAESYFFRSLNYFSLIKDFGEVPMILEPVGSLAGVFVEKESLSVIYDQIVNDLKWSLDNGGLANQPFTMNGFRVSRGAVETLLAEVYMQMAGYPMQIESSYALAAQVARSLIQAGAHKLIDHGTTPGESAYNFIRETDISSEYIFTIEMHEVYSVNSWPMMSFPPGVQFPGLAYGGGIGPGYQPSAKFLLIYDKDKDLRIQNQQFFYNSIEVDGNLIEWEEPVPWLWFDEKASFETARGSQDVKIMRYPLVLLIAAEAIARSEGVTTEAINYLADVRSRAYWKTDRSEIVAELTGLSVQAFVEEVWKERLRELCLDYKIWDDIRRTRKYPITSEANPGDAEFVDVIGADNGWGYTFQEHHLIYPIPAEEIQRNPNLTQNPGYE